MHPDTGVSDAKDGPQVLEGPKNWPWGEAMTRAYSQDMAVCWATTSQNNNYGVHVSIPGITDEEYHDLQDIDITGKKRSWNDG